MGAAGEAGWPEAEREGQGMGSARQPPAVAMARPPARQDGACPLTEQGEIPSACVPLALDGAALGLVLSCSTVVTSMSKYFISAWEPD